MRFVALVVVVAIMYVLWTRRGPETSFSSAVKEADAVTAIPPPAANSSAGVAQPPPQGSGLRQPLDRTRAVMEQVQQRAAEPF